ncbi:DUF2073 domain-containing protein [Halobacteriales archaeon QS_1_68_20]|nr:MAG: DUF2073 domain-containing protein [Halobacteriales archaeon QS_1_68_20]
MPEMKKPDGVQIDLIGAGRLAELPSTEKINMILDGVHEGKIVVLEDGLTPDEESQLIEKTMSQISPDGFNGIEIETYPRSQAGDATLLERLMGKQSASKLTVIGPADQIETLHKDESLITALVSRD